MNFEVFKSPSKPTIMNPETDAMTSDVSEAWFGIIKQIKFYFIHSFLS